MLFLYIDKNQIKLLAAKKSLFSQYSIGSHEKKFQVDLIKGGNIANVDVLASAIKEVLQNTPSVKDKQVFLMLPQDTFRFLRIEVPNDIAISAIDSFIKDKIKTALPNNAEDMFYDYFYIENGTQKYVSVFIINAAIAAKYQETLKLLDLELQTVLPETLSYFKLFEKTLRKGKIENILYGRYEKDHLYTYLYDSFGLLEEEKSEYKIANGKSVEQLLKQKGVELEKKNRKINRLILSGIASDAIRQDTFTKEVGMWTNPLKRIIPQFYQEYLKMLVTTDGKPLSILEYDVCLGAFIFSIENKGFSPLKRKYIVNTFSKETFEQKSQFRSPSLSFKFPKELILFAASFIVSFLLFSLISKTNLRLNLPSFQKALKPTILPTLAPPTPTPTPSFTREELKVKVLNGSGTRGKASVVKDILDEKKYLEIVTGNADNFDYKTTEIHVKPSKKEAASYLLEDMKDYTQKPVVVTNLDEKELPDVTVIVGQDFK